MRKHLTTDDTTIRGLKALVAEAEANGAQDDDVVTVDAGRRARFGSPSSGDVGQRAVPATLSVELRTGLRRLLGQ